jgi:hypothetical protein
VKCADCGYAADEMTPQTLAKGSSVREPGEPLCRSCTSTRITLVRSLDKIPRRLDQIRAKRMVVAG